MGQSRLLNGGFGNINNHPIIKCWHFYISANHMPSYATLCHMCLFEISTIRIISHFMSEGGGADMGWDVGFVAKI